MRGARFHMRGFTRTRTTGWIAASISIALTCFWAFWGIIENFHEGWHYPALAPNLGLMIGQYLSPMLLLMLATLTSLARPRLGAALHVVAAILVGWFFRVWSNPGLLLLAAPLIALACLYWTGRPEPRRLAMALAVGLPAITLLVAGAEPVARIAGRIDDGNLQARLVQGNEMALTWAGEGPGWPRAGADWHQAQQVCESLLPDGSALANSPQRIWRLPKADEAVRSMARHGANSGGVWDATTGRASYVTMPDKESPLWDVHSQVIYWWTATELDAGRAYIIAYDGRVWPRAKQTRPDSLGFRCVK